MYSFSMWAVANHRRLSGRSNNLLSYSRVGVTGPKSRSGQRCVPSRGSLPLSAASGPKEFLASLGFFPYLPRQQQRVKSVSLRSPSDPARDVLHF